MTVTKRPSVTLGQVGEPADSLRIGEAPRLIVRGCYGRNGGGADREAPSDAVPGRLLPRGIAASTGFPDQMPIGSE